MREKLVLGLVLTLFLAGAAYLSSQIVSATMFRDGTLQYQFNQGNKTVGPSVLTGGGIVSVEAKLKTCDPDIMLFPGIYYVLLPGGSADQANRNLVKLAIDPPVKAITTAKGDPYRELHRMYDWKVTRAGDSKLYATGTIDKGDWVLADDGYRNTALGDPAGPSGGLSLNPRGDVCGGAVHLFSVDRMWVSWYQKAWIKFDPTNFPVGQYTLTACHADGNTDGGPASRTDCLDVDRVNFNVSTAPSPRGNIFVEARDTDGNKLSGANWKFVSLPDKQVQPDDSKPAYYGILQGKYAIEAEPLAGYTLDHIQTATGTVLALGGANKNQVTQWLCNFSPSEGTVPTAQNCAKFGTAFANSTKAIATAPSLPGGIFTWLKNIFAPTAKAVIFMDTVCSAEFSGTECLGWTDSGGGGGEGVGGVGGGGGGGVSRPHISFILVYKKGLVVNPGTPTRLDSLSVNLSSGQIKVGDTETATAMYDLDGSGGQTAAQVTPVWSSSDGTIAGINTAGLITGVKAGTVTITAIYSGLSAFGSVTVGAPSAPGFKITGHIKISAEPINDGDSFDLYLSDVDHALVPANTATRLWIDSGEGKGFEDFGTWKTVAELESAVGRTRRLNCSSYSSYTPGKLVSILGKTLSQKLKVAYGGTGYESEATFSTKRCGGPPITQVCGDPDGSKTGTCPTGKVCQPASGVYSCVALIAGAQTCSSFQSGTCPTGQTCEKTSNGLTYSCRVSNSPSAVVVYTPGKIVPSIATIAVGESIQLHAYDAVPQGTAQGETTKFHSFAYDAFYVKQNGDQSGNFTGVNPGTVTITTGYSAGLAPITATITVTGTAVAGAGKITISSNKNIFGQMYNRTDCSNPYDYSNCAREQLGLGGPTPKILDSDPPVISWLSYGQSMGSKVSRLFQDTVPKLWTLDDPLTPVPGPSVGTPANFLDEWAGDPGGGLRGSDFAVSESGNYAAEPLSNGMLVVWANGVKVSGLSNSASGRFAGIVERSNGAFLISDDTTLNLTDADAKATYFETNYTAPGAFNYSRLAGDRAALNRLPSGFPRMVSGRKVILGDDNFVADFVGPNFSSFGGPTTNQLRIYDLGKTSAVATLDISSDIAGRQTHQIVRQKGGADTEYLFIRVMPAFNRATYKNSDVYNPAIIYGYKYTYSTKTLARVINGVKLGEPGEITAMTGFNVGGKIGLLVFTQMGFDYGVSGWPTRFESRARAYLLSDLASGSANDVLTNSPALTDESRYWGAVSTVVGDSTYAYVYNPLGGPGLYAWKLDSIVGGGPVVPTTPGSGNPPGPEPTAGSCDFTLTADPNPVEKTVPTGQSSYVSIGLATTKPADNTCPAVTVSLTTLRNAAGNTVATPLSTNLTISPGNSTVAIYTVSGYPGSYTLPIKAYGRGVQKTINVPLNVNVQ